MKVKEIMQTWSSIPVSFIAFKVYIGTSFLIIYPSSCIDLSTVSTSMTINAPAAILTAMYFVLAEEKGLHSEGYLQILSCQHSLNIHCK